LSSVPAASAVAPSTASPALAVTTITLLLGLAPISTDLYLPALPSLQGRLGTDAASAQLTLSVLIVCFGLGQLVCGPLADRFGRRPLLLGGLSLYTVAGLLCAAASGIEALIGWRAVQGLALAAAVTCGRSIVRDLFAPHEGARAMSSAFAGLGVIAMLGPISGGLLAQACGWRATLAAPALCGALTLLFVALKFDESLPVGDPSATHPARLLRNWRELLAHPAFRAWTALLCAGWGGVFSVLAGSAFVYIDLLGMSRVGYGAVLSASAASYIAGTMACRRLLGRHGLHATVRRGAACALVGGLAMAALAWADVRAAWAVALPQWLFAFSYGVVQPCAQAGVVGPFPERAGTAASLSGFAMMAVAFVVGIVLGRAGATTALPMALGVGAAGVLVMAVALALVPRIGEPR